MPLDNLGDAPSLRESPEPALDLAALLAVASGGMTPGEWSPGHLHRDDIDCDCAYVFSETCMGAVATVGVNNGLALSEDGDDNPPRDEAKANQLFIATFDPPTVRRLIGLAMASTGNRKDGASPQN